MTKALEALWRTARKLGRRHGGGNPLPPLLCFTDPARGPGPEQALARLPRGSGLVFRAFGAPDALAVGRRLAALARRRGVMLFVGADVALALALRADGVHLPERAIGRRGDTLRLRRRFRVTGAAHGRAAIRKARLSGIEAVIVSPVFPSDSPSAGVPIGARRFAALARGAGAPIYALGGVNAVSARRLLASGAAGLAAVGAFGQAAVAGR